MVVFGSPNNFSAKKLLLLGSGELGKEIIIEAQRYGIETHTVDNYDNPPASHVSHYSYTIDMRNATQLENLIRKIKPDYIVPEIESIHTETLIKLEKEGFNIIPSAKATNITMNRKYIRDFASKKLHLQTSNYLYASSAKELHDNALIIGLPCVVKPIMSSSGKGQSVLRYIGDYYTVWNKAITESRGTCSQVIIEEFIEFDYEITLLTLKHTDYRYQNSGKHSISFCAPIGHLQEDGDYYLSWQPHIMKPNVLEKAQYIAKTIVNNICDNHSYGIFGIEMFIKDDEVYFSELSPRPHDTGMVTMITQNLSEFALHVRAILELPIPSIELLSCGASHAILANKPTNDPKINIHNALTTPNTEIRLFGKRTIHKRRRIGVALAKSSTPEDAIDIVKDMICKIIIT